jgi:hypothetical protein
MEGWMDGWTGQVGQADDQQEAGELELQLVEGVEQRRMCVAACAWQAGGRRDQPGGDAAAAGARAPQPPDLHARGRAGSGGGRGAQRQPAARCDPGARVDLAGLGRSDARRPEGRRWRWGAATGSEVPINGRQIGFKCPILHAK